LIQRFTYIAIWTLSCCSVLFGQEPADTTLKTHQTTSVEVCVDVVVNYYATTVSGNTISEEQILQKSPEDLGDLTSSFSGVFVRSYVLAD
jgi:hypothetical protein